MHVEVVVERERARAHGVDDRACGDLVFGGHPYVHGSGAVRAFTVALEHRGDALGLETRAHHLAGHGVGACEHPHESIVHAVILARTGPMVSGLEGHMDDHRCGCHPGLLACLVACLEARRRRKEGQPMSDLRNEVRDRYAAAAKVVATGRAADDNGADLSGCCDGSPRPGHRRRALRRCAAGRTCPRQPCSRAWGAATPPRSPSYAKGETVLDLGSGGGIDVLLSAGRVGPTGKAYGLDMTDEMLELARANAEEAGAHNVEFLQGFIEDIPLPGEAVDVIISNCVINLSTDKPRVVDEMFRVLRPGGRLGISDVVADDHLTPADRAERGSYVGCIAGRALVRGVPGRARPSWVHRHRDRADARAHRRHARRDRAGGEAGLMRWRRRRRRGRSAARPEDVVTRRAWGSLPPVTERLFGTDGVRGLAGTELTDDLAYRLGRAAVVVLGRHGAGRPDVRGRPRPAGLRRVARGRARRGHPGGRRRRLIAGVQPTPAIAFLMTDLGDLERRGHLRLPQPARVQRHQVLRRDRHEAARRRRGRDRGGA